MKQRRRRRRSAAALAPAFAEGYLCLQGTRDANPAVAGKFRAKTEREKGESALILVCRAVLVPLQCQIQVLWGWERQRM